MTDPQCLVDDLIAAGWERLNGGDNYVRLFWPGHLDGVVDRPALFIPLDPAGDLFADQWEGALAELENAVAVGVKAAYVLAGIIGVPQGETRVQRPRR